MSSKTAAAASKPPSNNKVIVTGGTGYIGYALLKRMRESQLSTMAPVALARASSNIVRLEKLLDYPSVQPTVVVGDLSDTSSLHACVSGARVVIHLAADMDFYPRDAAALMRTNVEGTRNLLEACAVESEKAGRRIRFVYVSSTEVIGSTHDIGIADETAPRRPDCAYGQSKLLSEDVVKEYSKRLDTVIVRPTGVYGPNERFFFFEMLKMVASGIAVIAPSPMTGRLMFTHVDDVVSGLIICATHRKAIGETFNLCADAAVTNRAMVELIADVLQCPRPAFYLPERIGVALMTAVAPVLNWGKRRTFIYHPDTVRKSMRNREYSNRKLRGLGYAPKYAILAGMEQTVQYEMYKGNVKREFVPTVWKKGIHFLSVITFAVSRVLRRKTAENV